jgi:DNA-binding response OmpR family regulator
MKTKQVAIFESDKAICELIELLLLDEGYDVIASTYHIPFNAPDSLPDLILLDHWLNQRSGAKICQQLKTSPWTAGIPIIITSTDLNIEVLAAGCQADAYISKPFDIQSFLDQVKRFV